MAPNPAAVASDPAELIKQRQRETWATGNFADVATFTTQVAGHLVRFAGVAAGERVLDVGTGTGVAAITAARLGAKVSGLDLTPELLEKARASAALAGAEVAWQEGDAERLPYPDASFDVVLSQFGHMFAPRPEAAASEMLRVLRPGGRIAVATWPPEQLIGRLFALVGQYVPPPPGGAPPPQWGDPGVVRSRLGAGVRDVHFERGNMAWPALSPAHYRAMHEASNGPFIRAVAALRQDPARLAAYRAEYDALVAPYLHENVVRHEYLLSRAVKA